MNADLELKIFQTNQEDNPTMFVWKIMTLGIQTIIRGRFMGTFIHQSIQGRQTAIYPKHFRFIKLGCSKLNKIYLIDTR